MVDKAKNYIPDFLKEGAKNVKEPLERIEKALEKAREKLSENVDKIDTAEFKKLYDEMISWIRATRIDVEEYVKVNLEKTIAKFQFPSRKEVDALKKQVASLTKALAAAKAPAKKASPKKAPKKAPKKVAKKVKK